MHIHFALVELYPDRREKIMRTLARAAVASGKTALDGVAVYPVSLQVGYVKKLFIIGETGGPDPEKEVFIIYGVSDGCNLFQGELSISRSNKKHASQQQQAYSVHSTKVIDKLFILLKTQDRFHYGWHKHYASNLHESLQALQNNQKTPFHMQLQGKHHNTSSQLDLLAQVHAAETTTILLKALQQSSLKTFSFSFFILPQLLF